MSKEGLLIICSGGHGKVVAEAAQLSGLWDRIAFLDDQFPGVSSLGRWKTIGKLRDAPSLVGEYSSVTVALGENKQRLELINRFEKLGFKLPAILHTSATISPSVIIEPGAVVLANACINIDAKIGRGVIINTAASVDHDCVIEEGVHISPGAHLGGNVVIGRLTWVGLGASIINNIKVGNQVTVGAGAVVIRDVSDGLKVVGNPSRVIETKS